MCLICSAVRSQGMLDATATIEELRRIPDATVEEAERSHSLFAGFEKTQAPYKSALEHLGKPVLWKQTGEGVPDTGGF